MADNPPPTPETPPPTPESKAPGVTSQPGRPSLGGSDSGSGSGGERHRESDRSDTPGLDKAPHPVGRGDADKSPERTRTPEQTEREERADRIQGYAKTLLGRSEDPNANVKLDKSVAEQLKQAAEGRKSGASDIAVSGKGKDGKSTDTVLGKGAENLLKALAELTKNGEGMRINSWVRGSDHGAGSSADITSYNGHDFNEYRPDEARAAAQSLLKNLPPGDYTLGLPRLPTKEAIPNAPAAEQERHAADMKAQPKFYAEPPTVGPGRPPASDLRNATSREPGPGGPVLRPAEFGRAVPAWTVERQTRPRQAHPGQGNPGRVWRSPEPTARR